MSLKEKSKTGLYETRLLILGGRRSSKPSAASDRSPVIPAGLSLSEHGAHQEVWGPARGGRSPSWLGPAPSLLCKVLGLLRAVLLRNLSSSTVVRYSAR
jgi:hypothetical protein